MSTYGTWTWSLENTAGEKVESNVVAGGERLGICGGNLGERWACVGHRGHLL